MKKSIAVILIIIFTVIQVPMAYADNTVAEIQSGTEVTLSGKLDTTLKNETVSCVVTDENGKYVYMNFAEAEDGVFSFKMRLDAGTPTEELTAIFSSEYMNDPVTYRFLYKGSEELSTLLERLNAAETAQEYGRILTERYSDDMSNMEYLNLDGERLNGLEEPYTNIYGYIQSHGPYTADNFGAMTKYYLRSVELETINQADAAGVKEAMLTRGKELGAVIESSETEKLISEHIASGYNDLIYEKMTKINIASEEGLKNAYDSCAALTAIEHPENGRFDTAYVIENFYEALGLSQYMSRFKKLSDTRKITVLTEISGKAYTADTLKEAFSKLIAEHESEKESSGGGIRTNTVSRPNIQTTVPDEPKSELPKEQEGFRDIGDVPWAAEAIGKLKDKGVVNGRADGIFEPYAGVTREEFVKMIVLAFGMEISDGDIAFNDAAAEEWYGKYIKTASDAGIIYGIGENQFGIGMPITRQDIAVIVYRILKAAGKDAEVGKTEFNDEDMISEYAAEAVSILSAGGVITGTPEGNFEPLSNATRAEAAVIIYRAMGIANEIGETKDVTSENVSEKARLLDGLGFLDLKYRGRTDFTRGEFAEIAVKLFGYSLQKIDVFSDVASDSPYYEAVGTAASRGLISKDKEYFFPDERITRDEALRIFVAGLGYAPVIESGGENYISIASRLGLMTSANQTDGVAYDDLVNAAYNLLNADIIKTVYYGTDGNEYEKGGKLLEEVHNIHAVKGYITETEVSGLYGPSTVGKNEIKIKNAKGELTATMQNAAEYLGRKAEIYVRYHENNENEVVYIRTADDGVRVIQGEDVDRFDGRSLRYYDGDTAGTIQVSEDTAIIYNGVAVTSGEELAGEWYKPENGDVTFVKGESGVGDILIVTAYECIVFSALTEKGDTLTLHDKYGGRAYTCEKDQIVFYDQSGDEINPSALSEYDVISVCAPKAMNDFVRVRAYVSNNGITGTITTMNLKEKELTLEAESFRLTNNLVSFINAGKAPAFRVGQSGKFYVDHFGKLAAFDTAEANTADTMAYLINILAEDGLDECAIIKVLTAENKIKTYKTKDKVRVDDKIVSYKEFYDKFVSGGEVEQQLILLKLNEDETVYSVYTAKNNGEIGRLVKTYTPKKDSETLAYRAIAYGLGGKMVIGISATKVFVVPNKKTLASANDDDYIVTTRDYFVDGLNYRVQGYSVSEENVLEDAVVVYTDAGSENIKITDGSTLGLVDEVFRGINEDDEEADAVTMMYNGNRQTFYADDDVDLSEIRSGDAVQIKLDAENRIQKIRKVFDYETRTVLMGNTYGSFLDGLHLMYGPCINIKDSAMEQESVYSNGLTDVEKFLLQGNCYVYDSSLKESRARIGSSAEILPQRLAGEDAAVILSRRNGGTLREYIIYK